MTKAERLMEELGVFIHGGLTFGHAVGFIYNLRKRNWFDTTMHGIAGLYDLYAVGKHINNLDEKRN